MLVYRVCSGNEIIKLFNDGNFSNVGNFFKKNTLNTHNYKSDKKYLHFFQNIESVIYIETKGRFLCAYDIPNEILEKYKGFGNYMDVFNFSSLVSILEYAIEVDEMDFEYLESIDRIKSCLEIEDYLKDKNFTNFIDPVYKKETKKKVKKI